MHKLIVIVIGVFALAIAVQCLVSSQKESRTSRDKVIEKKRKFNKGSIILSAIATIALLAFTPILQLPAQMLIDSFNGASESSKSIEKEKNTNSGDVDSEKSAKQDDAVQEDVNSNLSNQPQESIDPSKSEEEATANHQITVSEQHTPNNIATQVSYCNWDVENDLGITGKRYGGGLKITITNSFTAIGSTLDNDITSQLVLQLPINNEDPIFEGIIVLHNSMYGSKSHGNIRILVDGEEQFSTGDIDGDRISDFPFNVDITGADTIIVEADATVSGGSFEYGLVA